jgi:hypothetical protein
MLDHDGTVDEPAANRSRNNNAMDPSLSEEERSHAAIAAILAARSMRDWIICVL